MIQKRNKSANIMFGTYPEEKEKFKKMCEKRGHKMAYVLHKLMTEGVEMKGKGDTENEG